MEEQDIDEEELQSFREYQKMRKQQERQKQLADLENLKRELEILEMEC